MKLKDEFPLTKDKIYFNTAAIGAMPASTIQTVEDYTQDLLKVMRGEGDVMAGPETWKERRLNSKNLLAEVIGAKPEEIAYAPNCTTGINTAFNMIPIKKGQNIVSTDLEFPMGFVVVNAQKRRGAKTRFLKGSKGIVTTEQFEKAIDDDTAIVYIDNPAWFNGLLFDVKAISELAHDHGAHLVVDTTQSFGSLDWKIDTKGVDYAATSTYKWLMGGIFAISAGFLYINEEHLDAYNPLYVSGSTASRNQIEDSSDGYAQYELDWKEGIGKYETYNRMETAYVAVENSMRVLLDHGMKNVENQVKKVDTVLVDGLLEEGYELQTPADEAQRIYLNLVVPDPGETVKELQKHDVHVSSRVGGVRISPHFYNTKEEAEKLLEKIKEVTK
jgi:cysteine desulfurase/selenocysteine lyase